MNKLILLFAVILSVSLSSCGDNGKDDPTPPTPKPTTNKLTYTIPDINDLFDMVDVTVEYTKADGTVASEPMTAKTWTKEITGFKTPFVATMKTSFVKKAGFTAEDKAYTVTTKFKYSYSLTTGDMSIKETGISKPFKTKAALETFLTELVKTPKIYTFDVPAKK